MKFKKIISASLCSLYIFTAVCANASMLGSETIEHARLDIGKGAVLETNVFYGDQSGVGKQAEYFVEYTPNSTVIPALINTDIYGRATTSSVADTMLSDGKYPTMLMNSDFFALNTGIPLSHQVIDGELVIMDAQDMDAIGFNEDGSAFISYLSLKVDIENGETTLGVGAVNKLRQPYAVYLFTDMFGSSTRASSKGINVVLDTSGERLNLGKTINAKVESVTEDEGEVEIPQGKIVLSVDLNASEELVEALKSFKEGDKVKISVNSDGDVRWNDAVNILGAWGGRIIKDSEITEVDESAAPRTAFGIKADGTLIFYALDGRQTGHSYGARLKTLAKRLLEIGCVDAVNLDGGGSTTIGTIYPGMDSFSVINKPSDGAQRKVASFLALVNTASIDGKADKLFIYPYKGNYLSGATVTFSAYATDKNYYKSDVPEGLVFTAPDGSKSYDGKITLTGDGTATVKASAGKLIASVDIPCFKTPTSIKVTNSKTGKSVSTLSILPDSQIELNAYAYVGNKNLIGDDSCFVWKCSDNIGTITKDGLFKASSNEGKGKISITAGQYTKEIDVEVKIPNPYIRVEFEEDEKGNVTIHFESDENKEITSSNVSVKADGKEVKEAISNGKINLVFSDNKTHKISVTAVADSGHTTVALYTLKGESYNNIFEDVSEDLWARDYITYMNNFGVVNGSVENGKTYFKPTDNITRAEFAVMVANLMGIDTSEFKDEEINLDDIDSIPSWCSPHIKALSSLGVMTGKAAGGKVVFDPMATLSRAEAVTVISRLLPENVELKQMDFADKTQIPSWSNDAFTKLTSLGIINGYSDNTVKPTERITRAEVIKILYEIY